MATFEEVQQVVRDLGGAYGVTGLDLDENGDCSLLIGGRTAVDLHYDETEGRLVLESLLGDLPGADVLPVLEMLARGNRLGIDTVGGTLALGPNREVVLQRELPHQDLTLRILEIAVEAQAEAAADWKARLQPAASTPAESIPPPFMLDPSMRV
jgi:hypothetical protein